MHTIKLLAFSKINDKEISLICTTGFAKTFQFVQARY